MNWNAKEVDVYLQQKEYIDTLVVPLIKIEMGEQAMKSSASSSDFLMYLTKFLEAQFKGRMMFTPPFTYTNGMDITSIVHAIEKEFSSSAFKYLFFVSTDAQLATMQLEVGKTVWLPSIPIESMDPALKQTIMEDQLKQVLPIFVEGWS